MSKIRDSIQIPLLLLKVVGLHYETIPRKIISASLIYTVVLMVNMVIIFIQVLNSQGNIFNITKNIEAFFAFAQHLGKVICVTWHKSKIQILSEETSAFKDISECSDKLKKNAMRSIHLQNLRVQKYFISIVLACTTAAVVSPLFGTPLPLGVWTMENHIYCYRVLLILEVLIFLPTSIIVCAIDVFFLAICAEIIIQLELLGYNVEQLKMEDVHCSSSFHLIIKRHISLLWLLGKFAGFYSHVLAVECLTIIPMICTEMYLLCERWGFLRSKRFKTFVNCSNNMNVLMKGVAYLILLLVQLCFYCIPIEYVANKAVEFGSTFYHSLWYTTKAHEVWRDFAFIIQRCQEGIRFTAGGFLDINARTLLVVTKMAWAACNVLRAIKAKNE